MLDATPEPAKEPAKFSDPDITAKGERRAVVPMVKPETLWFNTGTLCNIECFNCYIESSPTNDRLVYLTEEDVVPWLDEAMVMGTREIGFTGGEPYLNPAMNAITEHALKRGYEVLMLTNAMKPMMRPRVQNGLLDLHERFGDTLTMRVSLDHYTKKLHEQERGAGAFDPAMTGLRWLAENGFKLAIAGRTCWGETEEVAREGYRALFKSENILLDADNPDHLILFPEMDEKSDPPEITTACWSILDVHPKDIMCATSRMVIKRKGAAKATAAACTLLPYDPQFEMGETLKEASKPVKLNHPHCATFCVLGGGSCSG